MTKYFRAHLNQDAYITHSYVVEADDKSEAKWAGHEQWKGCRDDVVLVPVGTQGYDHVEPCDIEDVEEISKEEYDEELAQNKAIADFKAPTTFDEAQEMFRAHKSNRTAEHYLRQAMTYEADGMIGDDTFLGALAEIRDWLATQD